MKKIKLTNSDQFLIVDNEDYEKVSEHKWRILKSGFAATDINRQVILAHKFILNKPIQKSGYEFIVTHKNGNKLDNRKENLDYISVSLRNQTRNREYKNKTSRFKGVCWVKSKGMWKASISIKGKHKHLGYYENEEEAALAYNRFCEKYYGDGYKGNIIEE